MCANKQKSEQCSLNWKVELVCVRIGKMNRRHTYSSNLLYSPPPFSTVNYLLNCLYHRNVYTSWGEFEIVWLCTLTNKGGGTCLCISLSSFKQEAHTEYKYNWWGKGKGWVKSMSINGLIWLSKAQKHLCVSVKICECVCINIPAIHTGHPHTQKDLIAQSGQRDWLQHAGFLCGANWIPRSLNKVHRVMLSNP